MHRKDRLAEVECFAQTAYVQRAEIPDRCRAQRFVIPKRNLADRSGLMQGNKVLA
ncbi:hypothetical protein D3C77_725700 [compost metagenome]